MSKKIFILLILNCISYFNSFSQFRSTISFVPEFQFGYSSLSFRDSKDRPFKTEGGNYMQFNLGLNVPYSSNLTLRASGLINKRNVILGFRDIDTSNGNPYSNIYWAFKTINVGGDVCLLYTKYLRRNKQLFLGLGYFINYGLGGKIKATYIDEHFEESPLFETKNAKEMYTTSDAFLNRKNTGVVFKAGYKTRRNFYYSLFFNLGVENIRADRLTKFSSMRTNEGGISIGYFIRTD